jgi:hypothetical protein
VASFRRLLGVLFWLPFTTALGPIALVAPTVFVAYRLFSSADDEN